MDPISKKSHSSSVIDYTNGKSLMLHGSHALHDNFATQVDISMGTSIPRMEIRFKNLTLSTTVVIPKQNIDNHQNEIPTIFNEIKSGFSQLYPGNSRARISQILVDLAIRSWFQA